MQRLIHQLNLLDVVHVDRFYTHHFLSDRLYPFSRIVPVGDWHVIHILGAQMAVAEIKFVFLVDINGSHSNWLFELTRRYFNVANLAIINVSKACAPRNIALIHIYPGWTHSIQCVESLHGPFLGFSVGLLFLLLRHRDPELLALSYLLFGIHQIELAL